MTMRDDMQRHNGAVQRMTEIFDEIGTLADKATLTRADDIRFYELAAEYDSLDAETIRLEESIDAELAERRKDAHATVIAALAG